MNVCLISREYPPFFGGGIGTYTVQWSRTLAASGHRVVVVTVTDDGIERREDVDGVTVVRLPFLRGNDWGGPHPNISSPAIEAAFRSIHPVSAFAMQVEAAMPRLVREHGIEVIEVPDTGAAAWFGLNNRRTGGVWRDLPPVLMMIHSPSAWISRINRQPLKGRFDHELVSLERDSAQWCDAAACPSRALADWSAEHWGLDRRSIEVIPYPLGELESQAQKAAGAEAVARSRSGPFKIAFIGRLEPRKGVDTLMAAAVKLMQRGLELEVDLVGEDTVDPGSPGRFGANSLRELVPEAFRSRIRLLGRKSPAELPAIRDAADIVAIPSPMDNYPYACIEAMAEGRLIVACSAGGTGEMIRDGKDGLLFDPADPESCAEAIARAIAMSGEERARTGRSAAARILDTCRNDMIVAQRIEHYRRVIAASRPSTRVRETDLVVVNAGATDAAAIDRLKGAVRQSGADFAIGWPRTEASGIVALSTPSIRTYSLGPRVVGPLVAARDIADTMGDLLRERHNGSARTDSTWVLAMAMCEAGFKGLVVPDCIVDVPNSELHPGDMAPVVELKAVYESRGWRMLERLYDLMHIVRGRGIRRPEYDGALRGRARTGRKLPP